MIKALKLLLYLSPSELCQGVGAVYTGNDLILLTVGLNEELGEAERGGKVLNGIRRNPNASQMFSLRCCFFFLSLEKYLHLQKA